MKTTAALLNLFFFSFVPESIEFYPEALLRQTHPSFLIRVANHSGSRPING